MPAFFSFLRSRQFFIHLGLIVAFIFLAFLGIIHWLSSYTEHGEFVSVPDFKGQKIEGLAQFIKDKSVSYQIIDSIYDPKEVAGVVLRQDPEATTKVKHNRTVYLYVTGKIAPQIRMPKLIDRSERQAKLILITYGLRVGKVIEKRADCNGCVLEQLAKGKEVMTGSPVKKGSKIDLVVGRKDHFRGLEQSDTGNSEDETAPSPDGDLN